MARPHPVEIELAHLAHRLWCEEMIADGWTPGPFDPALRTHDALVTFDQLAEVDRHSTTIGVVSLDLIDHLRSVPFYPRGRERELVPADLTLGVRVISNDEPDQLGTVRSWEVDPDWPGCLSTITVAWDSGEVNVHAAAEREFRVADEP